MDEMMWKYKKERYEVSHVLEIGTQPIFNMERAIEAKFGCGDAEKQARPSTSARTTAMSLFDFYIQLLSMFTLIKNYVCSLIRTYAAVLLSLM